MSLTKGAALLLLLAAVSINADDDNCGGLNKTIPAKDVHMIVGDWVLVHGASDSNIISVENITTSHVSLELSSDNSTILLTERNHMKDGSCTTYTVSFEATSDEHKMELINMTEVKDGVPVPMNESASVQFFETGTNRVSMVYRESSVQYLLHYVREGHHLEKERIAEGSDNFQKLSACVGLSDKDSFTYTENEEFCHKKPPAGDQLKDAAEVGDA